MHGLDSISYDSSINKSNPSVKVLFSMGSLLMCVMASSVPLALIILIIMSCRTVYISKIKRRKYVRLYKYPLLFLFISSITIILNISKQPIHVVLAHMGSYYITISKESCILGIHIILIALASISCMYFLILTTSMIDLLKVMKRMKIPDLIIELMLLIYRFIVILIDISDNITIAQISRLGRRNIKITLKSIASLMSVLFIHAIRKANRLYDAMESRNYDGRIIGIMDSNSIAKRDLVSTGLYFLFLFIILLI